MANLLKATQNTSKLGAYVHRGIYGKTDIDWAIEQL